MPLNALSTSARRLVYSLRISSTASCGPVSATAAASWTNVAGPRLDCCSERNMLWIIGAGAAQYPTRHPVIAYVFDRLFSRTVRSRKSADSDEGEMCLQPWYVMAS